MASQKVPGRNFAPLPHGLSSQKTLSSILDDLLRKLPEKCNIRALLLWLLYSVRLALVAHRDFLDDPHVLRES